MKRLLVLLAIPLAFVCADTTRGCDADSQVAYQQEQMMREANAQASLPAISNFQEKKIAKMVLEMRDQENLATWVYLVNQYTGRPVFLGRALGFGIPYAAQYSSPTKPKWATSGGT